MKACFGKQEHRVIGYSLDFYSPVYNLVIEWNEERKDHYINGKLTTNHKQRQRNIIKHLKCKFINIRQKTFDKEKQIQKIKGIITLC
jgi:hypothetical protein